jgi:UDP-N-acetylglucosamine kinase
MSIEPLASVTEEQLKERFQTKAWPHLFNERPLPSPQDYPIGYVLGGQPGAGKSGLTNHIQNQILQGAGAVKINGDEFRQFHPNFDALQEKYGSESSIYTGEFSGQITNLAIQKAIAEKYHVIIEGTFRTAEIPINTLKVLKENGYKTGVGVQTCPQVISFNSTQERYHFALKNSPDTARSTPKLHHDKVAFTLAKNTGLVFASKAADHFFICSRQGVIFDSAKTLRPYTQQQVEDKTQLELKRKPDTKELLQSVSHLARYKNLEPDNFPFLMNATQQKQFALASDVLNSTSPDKKSETLLSLCQEIELITKQKDRGMEL